MKQQKIEKIKIRITEKQEKRKLQRKMENQKMGKYKNGKTEKPKHTGNINDICG